MSIDMAHVLASFQGPYPRPHPTQSPSYIKHTGFNVSVQNLNKYDFPGSLDKTCIMTPTEDERFSQHITTVKPLKFPSVFHPLVVLHLQIFFVMACLEYIRFKH